MSWRYIFAPFGLLIYIVYFIGLLLLPFIFLYTYFGPSGITILILIFILAGIFIGICKSVEKSERFSEAQTQSIKLVILAVPVLLVFGIIGYGLSLPPPSIGDTQTIGGLEVTVEDTYLTESVQTYDGKITPSDLSEQTVSNSADQFLVVILTVDEVEGSFYNHVDDVSLLYQESVYSTEQPDNVGYIMYKGEFIGKFEGHDEVSGYPEYQAVIFPVASGELSEYRLRLRVTDDDGETETWRLTEPDE